LPEIRSDAALEVLRNRALQIDIYLVTYLLTYLIRSFSNKSITNVTVTTTTMMTMYNSSVVTEWKPSFSVGVK